jgi:hypothetical protein
MARGFSITIRLHLIKQTVGNSPMIAENDISSNVAAQFAIADLANNLLLHRFHLMMISLTAFALIIDKIQLSGALTRECTIFYFVIVIISVTAGSNFFRISPLNA